MTAEVHREGLIDTNVVILRRSVDPAELPLYLAISALTLAELSAGPHQVRERSTSVTYNPHAERARRLDILQRTESEFEPIPFDAEAARQFGRVAAAVIAAGRQPRRRVVDLMIAATAIAHGFPLYTANPADFTGLDELLTVVPVRISTT
jgi:predicted nucleic acid-binding protein